MINTNINYDENDGLCVCEDVDIPASERDAIDRVIEMYENGEFKESDFISFDEFKTRIRGVFN